MKRVILFLIYGYTILSAVGGPINGDPAPGRSPGPPQNNKNTNNGEVGEKINDSTQVNNNNNNVISDDKFTINSKLLFRPTIDDHELSSINPSKSTLILPKSIKMEENLKFCLKNYLKQNEIFIKNDNGDSVNSNEPVPLKLDVTHDKFDTYNGLVHDIIYSGESLFYHIYTTSI